MNTQTIEEQVDLTGKTAIVTGGATGIGRAVAIALADCGAAVMIGDNDLDGAYDTVDEIKSRGGRAQAIRVDLSSQEDAEILADATVKCFGSVDILVNGTAAFSFSKTLTEIESLWRETLKSHLKGLSYYCRAAAEEMIEGGREGRIINMASVYAMRPPADSQTRVNSVAAFSKKLSEELAPHGITVNALAPSLVQRLGTPEEATSPFPTTRGSADGSRKWVDANPNGMGTADEIATIVLFLVSPPGRQVTGNLVVVG